MQRLLTTTVALAVVVVGFAFFTKPAEAATYPLSGYAWSENIGWIKFCGTDPCTTGATYKVIVDSANGIVSGYAWSENMGWLSFNQSDLSGCPSGTCQANLNIQAGTLTGWAKWLTTGEWMHLTGSNYGVTYNQQTREFSGYSWSDTQAGWVKWKNNNPAYKVYSENPIVAPPEAPTNLNAAAVAETKTSINFTWQDNSSGETGFKIERKTSGDWAQIAVTNPNVEEYNDTGLTCGSAYFYRVRATNNGGDSIYSNEVSASTLTCTATVTVDVTPNTATWTINPGNIQRTGDASVTVNPEPGGTTFTVTPGPAPSGYDPGPSVSNTVTGNNTQFGLWDSETAGVTITYIKSFDYTLSNGSLSYNPIVVGQNTEYSSVTITRTLTPDSGPAKDVSLSLSGVPAGVTYTFAPSSGIIPASSSPANLTINFTIPGGTAPANATVTVTGSPLSKTTAFNMEIQRSPDLNVVCSANPTTAQVGETVTWTVTPSSGTPPYGPYSWQGTNVPTEPAPNTQQFTMTYSTTGTKYAWATVFDDKGRNATCPQQQGFVNVIVNPSFEEF